MKLYIPFFDIKGAVIRSVIALFIGIAFIVFPHQIMDILVQVLGGGIILIALISFLSLYTRKNASNISGISIFNLIIALAIGLLFVFKSSFFSSLAVIVFGIVLVAAGIMQLVMLSATRRLGLRSPWYSYIFAILIICIGITIFFNPFQSKELIVQLLGGGLVLYAITDLINQFLVRFKLKKQGKKIVDGEVEDVDFEEVK
ncbi:MAG: DUF308 domain-containing protein [Bacteroidales bacterium]|jgi:uncharacterized membrane protein HdeD (DUF308 family)|nr:DUF308 domain-containing protein [Bacteroidales bacterium]